MNTTNRKPVIALTMGDPAGIGPEIIVKAWRKLAANSEFRFVVFGRRAWLQHEVAQVNPGLEIQLLANIDEVQTLDPKQTVSVMECGRDAADSAAVGQVSAAAGQAAFDFLESAIAATLTGTTDAIVTLPINKEAIRLAGHEFPGHTEILADRCGVQNFAMMLYVPEGQDAGAEIGIGVVHTTLHQSLRSALDDMSTEEILAKCRLAHDFATASLAQLGINRAARIAVAALNPHAGENGLFGDEEARIISPAVAQARAAGIECYGPISCDTLMGRAVSGEFDMVVAMFHDQGHIALKLLGMHKAVNVTLGLPIVRTSVAHGTAFEIAGTGQADHTSLLKAVAVAKRLVRQKPKLVI